MRTGVAVSLGPADHARLAEVAADRNSPQKHVWRAQIVLLSAQGVGTNEIMRVTGKAKTCVWRWQERFMQAGVDGLLRDKTRPSRIPPLGDAVAAQVVALTLTEPPGETTHWTAAAMATACTVSVSSVHRIWRSHGLRPHQARQFKLSRDPQFAAKVRDIVGLYVHPFQGVHYLIRRFIDDESISKAVVSADFYFVIASGSSSPVHGPGTMVPKQARKQPPRAAGAY